MEEFNLKELLDEMQFDQPREKIIDALNKVQIVYDICRGLFNANLHFDYETFEAFKKEYHACCPSMVLENYGYPHIPYGRIYENYHKPLRFLKDQQKFLSRKLAIFDNRNN